MVVIRVCTAFLLLPSVALAQQQDTSDALSRFEEFLELRADGGEFDRRALAPLMVVSTRPFYESTQEWYPTAAVASLARVFGAERIRLCGACMGPRADVREGSLVQSTGALAVDEIVRLDTAMRGDDDPAVTAVWLDESPAGVSYTFVNLSTGRLVLVGNIDPTLAEERRILGNQTLTEELERRNRGDALTHVFFDATLYPSQHIALDWTEQWGGSNRNLSGFVVSFVDPVLGLGGSYYRVVPEVFDLMVGGKVILSLPSALAASLTSDPPDTEDPVLTGLFVARVPIWDTNFGLTFTASTNGRVGVGVSLLNTSVLPFFL
ncbi:MAG: hypothetical protein AAFX94_03600 [Myxococcota bacterium]